MPLPVINRKIFYPERKMRLGFAAFVFLVISFILLVFQPFGTHNFQDNNKYGKLLGYGILGFAIFAILPDFLGKMLFYKWWNNSWTLMKETVVLVLTVIGMNTVSALYFYLAIYDKAGLATPLWQFQIWGFLILILPVSSYLFFLYKLHKRQTIIGAGTLPELLSIIGHGKENRLTLNRKEVLFIKASDNYVEIYTFKNAQMQKHLMRASLAKIYGQVKESGFIQVHRSYLVNIHCKPQLKAENGNYELKLEAIVTKLPVSRSYLKQLRKKLAETPL